MKSFDRQALEEQMRLVSRYVAGDLSRSERAEFEAWLVAAPELAAEVEMERRLRRGMASAARRGWLKRNSGSAATRERRWRVAIAASIVVALVAAGMSVVLPQRDSEPGTVSARHDSSDKRLASLTVRLSQVRGAPVSSPDLSFSRADAPAELVLEPAVVVLTCEDGALEFECPGGSAPSTPQYPEYSVELIHRSDASVAWRSLPQSPVAHTQLSFTVHDPGVLAAGDYDVIVRGQSSYHTEVIARFWLRISAQ